MLFKNMFHYLTVGALNTLTLKGAFTQKSFAVAFGLCLKRI